MRETDIIELVKEKYNSFTRLQKEVAHYILEKTDSFVFSSLDKIASEIGVSTTTIIRFAKCLGFAGYSEMQEQIRRQVMYKKSLPNRLNIEGRPKKEDVFAKQVFENDIKNIQETLHGLNIEQMEAAVDLIVDAKNIYVFGLRGAFSLAHSMALTLGEIKRNVRLISGIGMVYPEEVLGVENGDVCLIYAFPRYLRMVMDMVRWMKERDVKIIMITNQAYQKMEVTVDIVLPCFVEGYSFKSSMAAPMVLNNYIIMSVAARDSSGSKEALSLTEEWLNKGLYLLSD